ncbi:MAG: hypothetical protein GY810_23530 [Aureispira sp.]|nr:hypothetical protein [Aureispira sp.]
MKTSKEIKVAEFQFIKAFKKDQIDSLGGTFYPFMPKIQEEIRNAFIVTAIFFGLFAFLFYSTMYQDAVHYWHFDINVFIAIAIVVIFLGGGFVSLLIGLRKKRIAKELDEKNHHYGVVVTDEYYFENLPSMYQTIPKDNILAFSYAETLKDGREYVEFLLEVEGSIVTKGLVYNPEEFKPQEWVGPLETGLTTKE